MYALFSSGSHKQHKTLYFTLSLFIPFAASGEKLLLHSVAGVLVFVCISGSASADIIVK